MTRSSTSIAEPKRLGRVTASTDTQTLAIALIGTLHHLFLTHRADGQQLRSAVQRIVEALVTAITPRSQEQATGRGAN